MPDPQPDADGLLARLSKMMERAPSGDDDDEEEGGGRVPRHRLREVIAQRNGLRKEIEELRAQVESLKTGYEAAKVAMAGEVAAAAKAQASAHAEDLALVEAGLADPLGRAALRAAWEAQPADARGKRPSEWWSQQVAAHREHAEDAAKPAPSVPRTLAAYLPAIEAAKEAAPAKGAIPARRGPPAVDAGAGPAPKGIDALKPAGEYTSMDDFFGALSKLA